MTNGSATAVQSGVHVFESQLVECVVIGQHLKFVDLVV